MQKVLFVAHCILNTASKVSFLDSQSIEAEEKLRQEFLSKAVPMGIQLIQLPCPEFTLYGANRWGHVSGQFDNVFFRQHCKDILQPILLQLKEYLAHPDKFKVLGFIGIDGSPSCGVDYTCVGDWGGELSSRGEAILDVIQSVSLTRGRGVMIDVLCEMLRDEGIDLPISGLFADEEYKIFDILE